MFLRRSTIVLDTLHKWPVRLCSSLCGYKMTCVMSEVVFYVSRTAMYIHLRLVLPQRMYGPSLKAFLYKVVVKVGEREFTGEGSSAQAARHDAASKALQLLHSLPLEESCPANGTVTGGNSQPIFYYFLWVKKLLYLKLFSIYFIFSQLYWLQRLYIFILMILV